MAFKPITVNTPAADPAHILAEDDAALYESIIGGDCVLPIGQKMAATVQSNNKVRIADGVVVVGGHVGRIVTGDYEDMTIANGQSGKKRNDIIAARFLAGSSGGSDSYSLVVIQGTAGTSATDPVVVKGNLYAGDKQRDYPLWRVCIDGLSITKVEQMYEVGVTNKYLSESLEQANENINAVTSVGSLGTKDLNTITETGYYFQNADSNASTARHYPVAKGGSLEVIFLLSQYIMQRYTVIETKKIYVRFRYYDGSWQNWTAQ